MRTSLFNEYADLSKDFTNDFSLLWELPNETRQFLISKVNDLYNARTYGETNELMDKVVAQAGGDTTKTLRVLKVLLFIIQEWNPIRDKPELFYQDLLDLDLIHADENLNEHEIILDFLAKIESENPQRLKRIFSKNIVPNYKGMKFCIDYRAVFSNPFFSQPFSLNASEFSPQCIGFAPIILVELKLSSADNSNVIFQMDESDAKSLIDNLQASLKEMQASNNLLPKNL